MIVQLLISALKNFVIDPAALLDDHALLLFFFIGLLKQFPDSLILLVLVVLLTVCRIIYDVQLSENLLLELGHILCDLIEVLDSELHYSVEAPVDVGEGVADVEQEINYGVF